MTRDQELWGIALWLEKTQGSDGPVYITSEVARLAALNDEAGIAMWRTVANRYDRLLERGSVN